MARKPHPADDFNARLVANATSWSAFTQAGGRITRHFQTRDDARQAAQVMADGLKAMAINPVSTSPRALARYRDLALLAIEARKAVAGA